MKIKKITTDNMQLIYELIIAHKKAITSINKEDEENKKMVSQSIVRLKEETVLNNVVISIELSDISLYEIFILKRLTDSIIFKDDSKTYNSSIFNNDKAEVDAILNMYQNIYSDTDIHDKKNIENIIPLGAVKYDIVAIFKGASIYSIVGSIINKLFTHKLSIIDKYDSNIVIENISREFIKNFYSHMSKAYETIDVISEFMLLDKYYKYTNENRPVILSQINSPFGSINPYTTPEDKVLGQKLPIIKAIKMYGKNNTDVILTICSTITAFMEFFIKTPYVINHEEFKAIGDNNSININNEIISKYADRIKTVVYPIYERRKNIKLGGKEMLIQPLLIPCGQLIRYNIRVPYNFSELVSDGKLDYLDADIVGDIVVEIFKIINGIESYLKIR